MTTEATPGALGSNDQLGLVPARWYAVGRDGRATLCVDEHDARRTAKKSNVDWPHSAPYLPILMGDVTAEIERLARLAETNEDSAGFHSLSAAEIRAGRVGA